MKNLVCACVLSLGCLAVPVEAARVTLECTMSSSERHGWIPPRVFLSFDKSAGSAQVYDGVVHDTVGHPVDATLRTLSGGRLELKWKLTNVPARQDDATVSYNAKLDEATGKLRMTARVHGYDNRPYGSGSCKPTS